MSNTFSTTDDSNNMFVTRYVGAEMDSKSSMHGRLRYQVTTMTGEFIGNLTLEELRGLAEWVIGEVAESHQESERE